MTKGHTHHENALASERITTNLWAREIKSVSVILRATPRNNLLSIRTLKREAEGFRRRLPRYADARNSHETDCASGLAAVRVSKMSWPTEEFSLAFGEEYHHRLMRAPLSGLQRIQRRNSRGPPRWPITISVTDPHLSPLRRYSRRYRAFWGPCSCAIVLPTIGGEGFFF